MNEFGTSKKMGEKEAKRVLLIFQTTATIGREMSSSTQRKIDVVAIAASLHGCHISGFDLQLIRVQTSTHKLSQSEFNLG